MKTIEYLGNVYKLERRQEFDERMLWFDKGQLCIVDTNNDDAHVSNMLRKWFDREARLYLTERVRALSKVTGWEAHKLSFRRQKTVWGSCTSKKHVSLNMNLINLAPEIIDYVIIHELAHTIELNHSRAFWNLVSVHCENYPIIKARLRAYERRILTNR